MVNIPQQLKSHIWPALLFFFFLASIAAEDTLRIVTAPKDQVVVTGRVATFQCAAVGNPKPQIEWKKNGKRLFSSRYTVLEMANGVLLRIESVKPEEDNGTYECFAENGVGEPVLAKAMLNVINEKVPKGFPRFILQPHTHGIERGLDTLLPCKADGEPKPSISWLKDMIPINMSNRRYSFYQGLSLQISKTEESDQGRYECVAENTVGTSHSNVAILKVLVPVPPSFKTVPQNKSKSAAQTARFHCAAEGFPTPTITWLKDFKPLTLNGRIKIKQGKNNSLVISQLVISDSGTYQCVAVNSVGKNTASAKLVVDLSNNQPDSPKDIRAKALSSTSILLSWNPSTSPSGLTIQAYTVHYLPTSGRVEMQKVAVNTSQVIDKLEPYTNYTFYVRAYNGRSASEQSKTITCATEEDLPIGVPKVYLSPVSATILNVSWEELPAKIARGVVTGHRIHYRRHNQPSYNVEEFSKDIKHCTIEGLTPTEKYDVRVMCRTKVGYPMLSEIEWPWETQRMPAEDNTTLISNVPGPPILYLNSVNNSIEVKWKILADENLIDGFKLYFQNQRKLRGPIILKSDLRKHILNNVKMNQIYKIQLLAFNSSGDGIPAIQNISLTSSDKIKTPYGLEAFPLSPSSIKLSWKSDNMKNISHYTVRFNSVKMIQSGDNSSLNYKYNRTSKNDIIIRNLLPNTLYEFSVKAHDSAFSSKIECKTLEDIPSEPQDLTGAVFHNGTVRLNWMPPKHLNGIIKRYIILYKVADSSDFKSEFVGPKLAASVHNLSSNTQYTFCLRAETNAGAGPESSCIVIKIPLINASSNISTSSNVETNLLDSLDETDSLLGIVLGLGIGFICIVICVIIFICKNKFSSNRRCSTNHVVRYQNGQYPSMYGDTPTIYNKRFSCEHKEMESFLTPGTLMPENYLDTKGGNSPVKRNGYSNCNGNGFKSSSQRHTSSDFCSKTSSPLLQSDHHKEAEDSRDESLPQSVPLTQTHRNKNCTDNHFEKGLSVENSCQRTISLRSSASFTSAKSVHD